MTPLWWEVEYRGDGRQRSLPKMACACLCWKGAGTISKTSVLNEWRQVWDCKNVFVTDGACMTSSACQNPSLNYMALTARAKDFAVAEMKKQNV